MDTNFYVVFNGDGSFGFYDSNAGEVPSTAAPIEAEQYNEFFSNPGAYTVVKSNTEDYAKIVAISDVWDTTDYGETIVKLKSNSAVGVGAIRFTAEPTANQLKTAFPSAAGSRLYTISKDAAVGDTVTICGVTVTFTEADAAESAAAVICTALNADKAFSAIYKATVSGAVVTVIEIIKGNGNTPAAATTTGSIAITSGDAVVSVYGYSTAEFTRKLKELEAVHEEQQLQNLRGALLATLSDGSTDKHKEELAALEAWFDTEKEALINEQ